jgi:glycerol-3-phosphate O-acyltransferase
MREKKITRRQAMLLAQKNAKEIAANYSHAFVRFMEFALTRLWNRLYDGVVVEHIETLEKLAKDHEIIYVPCHRSHMDYLLLSYAIFRQGYAIPHIAAGINLNPTSPPSWGAGSPSSTSSKGGAAERAGCCSRRPECCR